MPSSIIQRVVAGNGSIFTGPGTNSYLIGKNDLTLVDPGPKIDAHIEHLIKLGKGNINRILVTHTHRDHSPGAKTLGEILNIPLMGRLLAKDDSLQDKSFKPDRILSHGDLIETDEYTIETIHTPGHASNHLCYLIQEEETESGGQEAGALRGDGFRDRTGGGVRRRGGGRGAEQCRRALQPQHVLAHHGTGWRAFPGWRLGGSPVVELRRFVIVSAGIFGSGKGSIRQRLGVADCRRSGPFKSGVNA